MAERRVDEFFVGYLPAMPKGVAVGMKYATGILLLVGLLLGGLIAAGHGPFRPSAFEWGTERSFHGTLNGTPVPVLRLLRPDPSGGSASVSTSYIVDYGKLGAASKLAIFGDVPAGVSGTLVFRDDQTMLELVGITSGEVLSGAGGARPAPTGAVQREVLGEITVAGEIVDSKCHFGVMNPGEGRTHRACAIRCISGGIPPVLRVLVSDGSELYMALVGDDGRALNHEILDLVAEQVSVSGRLERFDDLLVLHAEPSGIVRR